MSEHLGYEELRVDTVRQVAKLMAAAAITAPRTWGTGCFPWTSSSTTRP